MKPKRQINFEVKERIVPGSVLGILPFISEAIAHLTALPNFEEKAYLFVEDEPLQYPDFEWEEHLSKNCLSEPQYSSTETDKSSKTFPPEIDERIDSALKQSLIEEDTQQRSSLSLEYLQEQNNQVQSGASYHNSINQELFLSDSESDENSLNASSVHELGTTDIPIMNFSPFASLNVDISGGVGNPILFSTSGSFDPDGNITNYTFDFGDGNSYTETEDNAPDGVFDGKTTHVYNQDGEYKIVFTATDNKGDSTSIIDKIKLETIKHDPVFLAPGDTDPTKAGVENVALADAGHAVEDKPNTPWVEGRLDAVKNTVGTSNIIDNNQNWTAIANAYDPDGKIIKYDFWIDDNKDGSFQNDEFAGSSTTGEILIDHTKFSFADGETYKMKALAYSNDGGVAGSIDSFSLNNEAPSDIIGTLPNIDENAPTGTVIGSLTGVDPDNDTLSYSLVDNAGGRFSIDPNTGVVSVLDGSLLNYENAPSHDIIVQVSDGINTPYTETFTVNLNNVNEAPTDIIGTLPNIDENAPNGMVIGSLTGVDPDNDTLSYSLIMLAVDLV